MKNQAMKKSPKSNTLPSPNTISEELTFLKSEIELLKLRNAEKDSNKSWETSSTRKILIALFTFFVMVLLMGAIGVSEPFLQAIIPTVGFLLSTLSLSLLKHFWK